MIWKRVHPGGEVEYLGQGLLPVCAAGFSEPLPHYSLFCGQL